MLNNFPIADNLPVEPTVLSANMSFSDLTTSSVIVSWTNGDGSYRLLLAKENAPVSKAPVDGSLYVANNVFGNGADLGLANFVVFNGIGNSATITGLNNGSTYHFSTLSTDSKIIIYPNPTNGKIQVIGNQISVIGIEIYNMLGEKIYEKLKLNQPTSNEIDLSFSPKGIYFVKIIEGEEIYNKKIVVQ